MYQSKNLSVLSYANGFTLWHYTTEDTDAKVKAAKYFDGAADMLRQGDLITVNTDTASGAPKAAQLHVKSVKPVTVDKI